MDYVKDTFTLEAQCLSEGWKYIDRGSFERSVEMLAGAERIAVSGCGHSGIAARHFSHLLNCINLSSAFLSPSEAVHGDMGFLKSGDVMVFISRGGKTQELFPMLEICKAKNVKIITITENVQSPLANQADEVLRQYVNRETDRYNLQGTTSMISVCAVFHALQAALIDRLDFRPDEFALNHPGGAVGARLNKNLNKNPGENEEIAGT